MNEVETFWQAVAASVAAATALSTGLAWIIGNWARDRSRPEADWVYDVYAHVVDENSNEAHHPKGHIYVHGRLANAGDANAFRLVIEPSAGESGLTTPTSSPMGLSQSHEWVALLQPGESVDFWAVVHPSDWRDFAINLDWITSPTRLNKHLQFPLKPSDVIPAPQRIRAFGEDHV